MKKSNKTNVTFYDSVKSKLVTEKVEGFSWLVFLYRNILGKSLRFLVSKAWVARIYARYQSSQFSLRKIEPFVRKHNIVMTDFQKSVHEYTSFNEFFCREFKSGARNIDQRNDAIVSPVDGKVLAFPDISQDIEFFVKNTKFSLERFLRDTSLAVEYVCGSMMIFRLAPYDYHWFHIPVDGIISEPKVINGIYESVNPIVYKSGIQPLLENKRDIITIQTEQYGQVLMVPVGAMFVGRIKHEYQAGALHKKGDRLGCFEFGGSSVVVLFQKGTVVLNHDIVERSQQGIETSVTMGMAVAKGAIS